MATCPNCGGEHFDTTNHICEDCLYVDTYSPEIWAVVKAMQCIGVHSANLTAFYNSIMMDEDEFVTTDYLHFIEAIAAIKEYYIDPVVAEHFPNKRPVALTDEERCLLWKGLGKGLIPKEVRREIHDIQVNVGLEHRIRLTQRWWHWDDDAPVWYYTLRT